jgi:hypothetical protein
MHRLQPELTLTVGERLAFRPNSLKHNLYPEKMLVTHTADRMCPVLRLHHLLRGSAALGQPITKYLCRPLAADKTGFLERPLSVAAFEEDVAAHFRAAGVPYHATLHGSRRGSLQQGAADGLTQAEVGQLGQIKTPRVQAMYLAPDRHNPGPLPKGARPAKRARLGEFLQQAVGTGNTGPILNAVPNV